MTMQGHSGIYYSAVLLVVGIISVLLFYGYRVFYVSDEPLTKLRFYEHARQHTTLLVFLPGISDSARDFETNGFVSQIRQRKLPIDSMAVDAGVHFYISGKIVQRLRTDIILPALDEGYEHIWLAGVSLGGYGALLYTKEYPQDIAGVIAIVPYLGKQHIIEEISKAGGVDKLRKTTQDRDEGIYELWAWLENYSRQDENKPPLFLAYGNEESSLLPTASWPAIWLAIRPSRYLGSITG